MPERPDLDWVIPQLDAKLRGRQIIDVLVRKPVVLRCLAADLRGEILGVSRRAHFVRFDLGAQEMVVSPMLAGRFQLDGKAGADLALTFTFADGGALHYRDDVQMGKVYLIAKGAFASVPGLADVGVDALSPDFTLEHFRVLAKKRKDQVKVFLMDKAAIDSLGNAYADEAMWEARIHPKRMVRELGGDEVERLHHAIVTTLENACRTIRERAPPLPEKLRDFLHVRGRKGDPCDRCGTTLRTTGVHGHDAFFCPQCQPDVGGRGIVDWRRAR